MQRPYVTINGAISCDGKLASHTREKFRLSNEEDGKVIDLLRRESDAVLVGATTLLKDNPRLVLRDEENRRYRLGKNLPADPAKVTISPDCALDIDCSFFRAGDAAKYVFTTARASDEAINRVQPHATVIRHATDRVDVSLLLQELHARGIRRLLIEGGGSTNFEFIKHKLVDELRIAIAPIVVGGVNAPTFVDGLGFDPDLAPSLTLVDTHVLGEMVVIRYKFRDVVGTVD